MTDLRSARAQLEQAITRLEAALSAQTAASEDAAADKVLEEARAEYRNLREAADNVSDRIDAIIVRLRATLGEDAESGV
ncbi:MAG: hypothetical protein R3229_06190 [Alphaproteobacteria bacterium]|nr:hypothetical protein [Alphaproteobacteria bacterium]